MKALPMMLIIVATVVASFALAQSPEAPTKDNVLTYHGTPDRSGNYKVPGLTWERAKSVHLDEAFQARVTGNIYAQPLYWRPQGSNSGSLLVATEDNNVYALDAVTGAQIWRRSLGRPVPRSTLRCGNISPLGITGTPVIDEANDAVYLDAAIAESSGPRHRIFALSLKGGAPLSGWPIDVADALRSAQQPFNSVDQTNAEP
jgi:outer membrane protein assembly factor BamB